LATGIVTRIEDVGSTPEYPIIVRDKVIERDHSTRRALPKTGRCHSLIEVIVVSLVQEFTPRLELPGEKEPQLSSQLHG